jgi:SAM-dependent methyltransferase
MELMKKFVATHVKATGLEVLDVGSQAVSGGSYKVIFHNHKYTGLDMEAGANVDIVVKDPYNWTEVPDGKYDIVVSGQAFEHIEYPWETIRQIERVLKSGGLAIIIAPSQGRIHRWPVDTFRYHPDGMIALGNWAGLETLETFIEKKTFWGDCGAVFLKPLK